MAWRLPRWLRAFFLAILFMVVAGGAATAGGLGLPTRRAGLGFGNLDNFTGVRLNVVDRQVDKIVGLNVTFWIPRDNDHAVYQGVKFGLVVPKSKLTQGLSVALVGAGGNNPRGLQWLPGLNAHF